MAKKVKAKFKTKKASLLVKIAKLRKENKQLKAELDKRRDAPMPVEEIAPVAD